MLENYYFGDKKYVPLKRTLGTMIHKTTLYIILLNLEIYSDVLVSQKMII